MYPFKQTSILVLTSLIASANPLYATEHEQHGAHVHGEAQLLIALEGDNFEIEFHSPAMNIVGFEHQPNTEAQRKTIESAIDTLKKPDRLFILPPSAQCHSIQSEVKSPLSQHPEPEHHGHEHSHQDAHSGEIHSNFTAHYHYQCDKMAQLKRIEIELFNQFPATERIEVQSISPKGQQKVDLIPGHSTLEL
jgi:hypothetical protein